MLRKNLAPYTQGGFFQSFRVQLVWLGVSFRDAFLTERDAHFVRDAGFARDARLGACGTHRITYHSEAASLITYLQNKLIYGIIVKK